MSVYSGVRPSALFESGEIDFTNVQRFDGSIMELAVECEQNDMRMFESVIELDFLEAASLLETDDASSDASDDSDDKKDEKKSAASEEAEKTIWEKIKDLVKKAWDKIKGFFATLISKIQQLIGNDAALFAKYSKYWNADNLKGFKISGYTPLRIGPTKLAIVIDGFMSGIDRAKETALSKIESAANSDEAAKNYFGDEIKKIRGEKTWKDLISDEIVGQKIESETELISIEGGNQLDLISDTVRGGKSTIEACKKITKAASVTLKYNAKYEKAAGRGKKDLALAKANANYKVYNATIKELSQLSGAFSAGITKALSSARKAFITGGKYAKNKADGNKSTNESYIAYDALLGDLSDAYVESVMYGC